LDFMDVETRYDSGQKKSFLILLKCVWSPIEENKLMKYFKERGFSEVLQKLSQSVDYVS